MNQRSEVSTKPRAIQSDPWSTRRSAVTLLAAGGAVVAIEAFFATTTNSIAFNDGLGYLDGQTYPAMVRVLRGELTTEILSPYAYRVAPIMVLAWIGAPLVPAFLVLNLASLALCGPLLALLGRRYGASPLAALLGVVWWAVLPAGPRFAIYYPTLLDGVGQLAIVALLTSAVYGRFALFAAILPVALLTRENVVAVLPVLWLANRTRGLWRSAALSVLAALPGLAAFALVHLAPPIPPATGLTLLADIGQNLAWFRENAAGRAWRYIAAPWLTLGLLPVAAVATARRRCAAIRRPEWIAYVAAVLGLALVGGGDYDRFAFWLAPALVASVAPALAHVPAPAALSLTLLHAAAARIWLPLGTSEGAYRDSVVALMPASLAVEWAALVLLCAALGGGITLAVLRVQASSARALDPPSNANR